VNAVERALEFVAEFKGEARIALNCFYAEALAAEVRRLREERTTALTLATFATNGWGCHARTNKEHDEIARLHREIRAMHVAAIWPETNPGTSEHPDRPDAP
jgi:hypothetical protein